MFWQSTLQAAWQTCVTAIVLWAVVRLVGGTAALINPQWTLRNGFKAVAQRHTLAVLLVGIAGFSTCALTSAIRGRLPVPAIHDEFSYLLAGDTFAQGRITNDAHPMSRHFETYHVLLHPSYQSKYPPGQGLALAAGQLLGHPAFGVWLSVAAACAAITWMLQAWVPDRWALAGGLLAACHAGIVIFWGNTYWGGALGALGGALVLGAIRRIVNRAQVSDALVLGLGLAILANTRPFEGFVTALPVLGLLLWRVVRHDRRESLHVMQRTVMPLAILLIITGGAMAYYNYRITGFSLLIPYELYEGSYQTDPNFIWDVAEVRRTDGTPSTLMNKRALYRYPTIAQQAASLAENPSSGPVSMLLPQLHYLGALQAATFVKLTYQWTFYFGLLGAAVLLVLPLTLLDRWMLFALLTGAATLMAVLVTTCAFPHYAGPATAVAFILLVECLRRWNVWRFHGVRVGQPIVLAIAFLWAGTLLIESQKEPEGGPGCGPAAALGEHRQTLADGLAKTGSNHLVIVRYSEQHNAHHEWVYNAADIDTARVVWAHELDEHSNLDLLEYFHDRRVWLLEADAFSPILVEYPGWREQRRSRQQRAHGLATMSRR